MTLFLIIAGLALLFIGGEALLRGSVAVGRHVGLSPLVTGMVIVGLGTSMPELFVGVEASLFGKSELAVGNVIGSNIANILLILAVAALIRPIDRPVRVLRPDGLVLIAVTVGIVLLGLQGRVASWQGAVLVALLAVFLTWEVLRARRETRLERALKPPVPFTKEVPLRPSIAVLLTLSGLAILPFGANILIDGCSRAAAYLGVSEGVIGLTIVAIGTSLPELASAIVASLRGQSDIAYGNVVGSNLFNSLGILGASALAGPLTYPWPMVWLDGTVMIVATLAMIFFFSNGARLLRWEAGVMMAAYLIYLGARFQIA
ncbi:MAG: calcium/sodium antiporter [Methyloligellaceae bacterium]